MWLAGGIAWQLPHETWPIVVHTGRAGPWHHAVALFAGSVSELGLRVPQAGDRFNRNRRSRAPEEGVKGSKVTGDIERGLERPAPSVANSCTQASEQVELGSVAQTATGRVEARMKLEAHGSAMSGKVRDTQIP